MNKKETVQILAILKAAYPNFYKDMTTEEAQGTISVWALQFADMPADIVLMALNKAISTSKFPPTIAEIKEKMKSIYWEAYDKINPMFDNSPLSEEEEKMYSRIFKITERYKYDKGIEPPISQMLGGGNNYMQLSEGDYNNGKGY